MSSPIIVNSISPAVEEGTSFGTPSGVEQETSDHTSVSQIEGPFDPDDIEVTTRSMTIDLLLSRIEARDIDLEPDFQRRRGIWNERQQSRLIESLLLKIPLPTLYAAEDEEERWAIVDGIQRLSTITRFIAPASIGENPLRLVGLEYLGSSFDGFLFDQLPSRLKRRLRETELVVHVIRHGTPQEVKFNIFARINTGGMPLSAQELRHALIPGKAREFLAELAQSKAFKDATLDSIRDERMADREMILRFVAFSLYAPEDYKYYDFNRFLTNAMRKLNSITDIERDNLRDTFFSAMHSAQMIFENNAFRKRYQPDGSRFPINRSLFETVSVSLSRLSASERNRCINRKEMVRTQMMSVMRDKAFEASISQGTGDPAKVRRRFETVFRIFQRVANV